jgi:hypothetical protein
MNTILLLSELIISFASIIVLEHKYQKEGLYTWIAIAIFLENIMITKSISIASLDINLGIIIQTTIFITTNIIIQKEGTKEINKIILLLITTSLFSYFLLSLTSLTTISSITPTMDKSYNNLFLNNLTIFLANNISLLISLKISSLLYYQVKMLENKIWISNIISMIVSQLIYEVLFGTMYLSWQNTFFNTIIIVIIRFLLAIFTQTIGTIIIYYLNNKNS